MLTDADVIGALLDTIVASATFGPADTTTDVEVPVYDGPLPEQSTDTRYLLVGSSGDVAEGATFDLPPESRLAEFDDESGEIVCSAWAWSGDDTFATLRAEARALVRAAADAIAADRTLGGVLTVGGLARVRRGTYLAGMSDKGPAVGFTFTVAYTSALT